MTGWLPLVTATVWALILGFGAQSKSRGALLLCVPGFALLVMGWLTAIAGSSFSSVEDGGPGRAVWDSVSLPEAGALSGVAGVGLIAGVFLATLLAKRYDIGVLENAVFRLSPNVVRLLLVASVLLTASYVVIYGFSNLIVRANYAPSFAIPAAASFTGVLLPAGFTMAAMCLWADEKKVNPAAIAILVTQSLILFATASRLLSLLILLTLVIRYLVGRRVTFWQGALTIALGLAASVVALNSRNAPVGTHGFIGYSTRLLEAADLNPLLAVIFSVSNVLFAVPLMSFVQSQGRFTWGDLLLSLDPTPASSAAWAARAPELRVHFFIPYNGLGELAALSPVVLCVALGLLGILATTAVGSLARRSLQIPAFVALTLYYLSFALLLQYNLRSVSRILYVALAVSLALVWFRGQSRSARPRAILWAGRR